MRPGCFDVHERVRDMSAAGVLGGAQLPDLPALLRPVLRRVADKELALAAVRAYNDWHIDEWAGSYPDRLIPLVDPADCGIRQRWPTRSAGSRAKGCHAVTFSENPAQARAAELSHRPLGPVLRRVCRWRGHVCLHIGSSSSMITTAPEAPPEVMISLTPINSLTAITDILFSGVFKRFPGLTIAMSEGGDRLDSLRARAGRLRLPPPPRVDRHGPRWQDAERAVPRALLDVLHR